MSLNNPTTGVKETAKISPKELILKYSIFLPLVILSIALSVTVAYMYLRYTVPMYSSSLGLMIKTESKSTGSDALADNLGLVSRRANLANEIEILKSATFMSRVVDSLKLNIQYFSSGQVKRSEMYGNSPFVYTDLNGSDTIQPFSYTLKFDKDKNFQILELSTKWYRSGELIKNQNSLFKIDVINPLQINTTYTYYVQCRPIFDVAQDLTYAIFIKQQSRETSILRLTINTEVPLKGRDILNELVYEYNKSTIEDKNKIVDNTIRFIDSRLEYITNDLGRVEQGLQNFKVNNEVVDISMQGSSNYGQLVTTESRLNEQEVKVKMLDMVREYITGAANRPVPVLSNLGLDDPTLSGLIAQYNQLQLEREQKIKTIPAANPIIQVLDSQIERIRISILENLKTLSVSYQAIRSKTLGEFNSYRNNIRKVPAQEKAQLEITRQQGIKQELYLFLLQKREESAITRASAVANSYAIDPAISGGIPVSPDKPGIYRMAMILGLLLPVALIYLSELLKDKIITRQDVTKMTNVPILGEIAHHPEKNRQWVVGVQDRSVLSEQFRIIRTNLQFFVANKTNPVILITSSIAGEGKTFTSMNIGAVWAVARKKTVILELDLRKPKISSALKLENYKGISNYMLGQARVEELPIPVKEIENLYIIPAGPIPPNPSELLMDKKIDDMFAYLKQNFDFIIIDSAPIGLVSDTKILSRFADATLYIVRQRYTLRKQLNLVEDLYSDKVLPSMGLLVNDVKMGGLSSYYGSGYSYGYNYNSSYSYGEDAVKPSWWRRLFSFNK